jgi:hypothetical protein
MEASRLHGPGDIDLGEWLLNSSDPYRSSRIVALKRSAAATASSDPSVR